MGVHNQIWNLSGLSSQNCQTRPLKMPTLAQNKFLKLDMEKYLNNG